MGSDIQVLECMLKGMVPGRFSMLLWRTALVEKRRIELCNIISLLNSSITYDS